ncbi:uncharacterized protein F5891DRAFT_1281937 [Suillus fuscotomentosus]|uniref:Uncharacterized protein n=1 Tax=Suillus fuscotomentosus TaxID=1912939 RepID=A0AAD4DTM0_9AGAM|nr:uncharacterized protein F5891DRAFT_1281937 [Suillus fuscotomentosus]KAG1893723.1 hypothetical protein F5891DRAFT_1281937 [Suillus fuscotomentosus]
MIWNPLSLASGPLKICLPLVECLLHLKQGQWTRSRTAEFDNGADWLDGPAALSEFRTVEKDLFVLAASSGIDLCAPVGFCTNKEGRKNLVSSVPDPSAWDEWKVE